jgi:peroxiredoxin
MMKVVTNLQYLGQEKVDQVDCHHCRYDLESASVDVWFEKGDRPPVRKIVPDLTRFFAKASEQNPAMEDAQIQWEVTLKNWDTNAKLTDADFAFTPPKGAVEVESLFAGRGGPRRMGPHPLLGKPAPPFEVVDLDGNPVSLASYLGDNVVVLDFWATWCGPCVEALPEVDAVTAALQDRGVKFFAVNIGEDKQTVRDFLDEQKLDVPVALDLDSTVASLYRVTGIPQTVLIGKDGRVQVVHMGFGPNLGQQLKSELERLLKGQDLASEQLAAHAREAESSAVESSAVE